LCEKQRLAVYVTLHEDSKTAEFFAVLDTGDGPADLAFDGFLSWSRLPLVLSESLKAQLGVMMDVRSSSSNPT
jgi:hypothetical protein